MHLAIAAVYGLLLPQPTIWQAGIDGSFLANLAMLAVAGTATVMAYGPVVTPAAAGV